MKIATPIIALFLGVRALALAQSEIRIPTDAELQRMERGGIATSPLGTSAGPKLKGSEEAQNLQMDRQDRMIESTARKDRSPPHDEASASIQETRRAGPAIQSSRSLATAPRVR